MLELLTLRIYRQQPQATFEIDIMYKYVYDKFIGSEGYRFWFAVFLLLVGIFQLLLEFNCEARVPNTCRV